ncbi:MAG: choice-of-anchor D domain-containing protein, partial [Polyangiaceae bacterium]
LQRPGLLLMEGVVYAAFGSHCDKGQFHGFVVGVTTDGHQTPLFATEAGPSGLRGAGFWHSGGGIVSDGTGRLFLTASNGYSNAWGAPLPGHSPPQTLDQSVMRLDVQNDGSLAATDFFAPYDGPTLDTNNVDFGSGGPIGLPDCFGTTAHPHLLIAAGKQGRIYLLDRNDLGGYQQGPSQGDAIVSATDARDGLWSNPAVWPGEGGWVYIAPSGAPFQAFSYGFGTNGTPTLAPLGVTSDVFATFSGSPIVTSDGMTSGSALVWVYASPGAWGSGALRAYLPIPDATGTLTPIFQDVFGTSAKFAAPGVGDNRIYVGTADGYVLGYGATTSTSVSAKPVDFGMVRVGQTATRGVVVTASQATEIDAVASDDPTFFLAPGAPSFPAKLQAGASLTIPVGFSPAHAGGYAAALRLTTPDGLAAVSVQGSGQATGASLVVLPKSLAFEGIPPGQTEVLDLVLQNVGAAPMQFTTVVTPRAPFAVTGAPARGDVLPSGQSITLTVTYTPPSPGMYSDSLELASNGATRTIYLSGASATAGKLVLAPMTLDFGSVAVGSSKTLPFTVSDTGGTSLSISSSKPPDLGEFVANTSLGEGTKISGGGVITESVTFAPTSVGPAADNWQIGSTAGGTTSRINFTGTGIAGPVDAGIQ